MSNEFFGCKFSDLPPPPMSSGNRVLNQPWLAKQYVCWEIPGERWQRGKRAVCITSLRRSQTNNRAHFPPSAPEEQPRGSEGRVAVVKPRQEEACRAITRPIVCFHSNRLHLAHGQAHTCTVYGYKASEAKSEPSDTEWMHHGHIIVMSCWVTH